MKPLLSIVVPTKDRYKYLKHFISLIDDFITNEIELVIQDNTADNSEIRKFLSRREYGTLRYRHDPRPMSMSENIDIAIMNSSGEYVCFMGDDDGVLKNIVDCVRWMKRNDIDALRSAYISYKWPDYGHCDLNVERLKNKSALITINNKLTGTVERIDCIKSLEKAARTGFKHGNRLPQVYHGIVKRSCLDEVYQKCGTFFPGPSPDIANGVALSFVVKKLVKIYTPVIIVGWCQHAGGGEHLLKGRVKDIKDVPFLPKDAKGHWNANIPQVWCSATVMPESAIKALQAMGQGDTIKINYEYIHAYFAFRHPIEYNKILHLTSNKILVLFYFFYFILKELAKKIYYRSGLGLKIINGVQTIFEATQTLEEKAVFDFNELTRIV